MTTRKTPGSAAVTLPPAAGPAPSTAEERRARGRSVARRGREDERRVVQYLRAHGWPGAERTVRTGYQVGSRVLRDVGDIDGTPGIAWQVTNTAAIEQPAVLARRLAETEAQRRAAKAEIGVLVVRRVGYADPGDWWAWLPLFVVVHLCGGNPYAVTDAPVRLRLGDLLSLLRRFGYGSEVADGQ